MIACWSATAIGSTRRRPSSASSRARSGAPGGSTTSAYESATARTQAARKSPTPKSSGGPSPSPGNGQRRPGSARSPPFRWCRRVRMRAAPTATGSTRCAASGRAALLREKADQYGRQVVTIGRFEPTSQVCSACGVKDGPKPLGVREWTCRACGASHDRDANAARNVLVAAGLAETRNACGAPVRPSGSPARSVEAGTHRGAA